MNQTIKSDEPKWVLIDGVIHNVSEFASVPPQNRPNAECPICKSEVIMKLGDERVHHYAHKINIACAATNPETAQHLNTKFHIYNELLKSKQLIITKPCYGRCGYKKKFI